MYDFFHFNSNKVNNQFPQLVGPLCVGDCSVVSVFLKVKDEKEVIRLFWSRDAVISSAYSCSSTISLHLNVDMLLSDQGIERL